MTPLPPEVAGFVERVLDDARNAVPLAIALRALPVEAVAQIEHRRRIWYAPARHAFRPRDVARLTRVPEAWAALGVAASHPDGRVREAAVRALAWCDGGDELPFLILRLNDWVLQVRTAALSAIQQRLTPDHARAWIRALPLLENLRRQRRADHRQLIESIEALLRSPDARPALLTGLGDRVRRSRRLCFRLALPTVPLEWALDEEDIVIRGQAAAHVGEVVDDERRRTLIAGLMNDSAPSLRLLALELADREPEDWRQPLVDKLGFDTAPRVRSAARKRSTLDWPARYRQLISRGEHLRAALAGLAECGSDEDALLIEPSLSDSRGKVRQAALAALASLDRESVAPFVDALADPSSRVSRLAARILQQRFRVGLPDMLRAVAERPDLPPHARLHALDVAASLRVWPRLVWLLRATTSSCTELAALAAARINPVMGERPLPADLANVESALSASSLPPERIAHIRRELALWRA